jgi:hypothetical protein
VVKKIKGKKNPKNIPEVNNFYKNQIPIHIITTLIALQIPCSILFFCPRQHFHQRIPRTKNITKAPAVTIPTFTTRDRPVPFSDGGIKSV